MTVAEDGVRSLSRRARARAPVPAVLRLVCATVVLVSVYFPPPFTTVEIPAHRVHGGRWSRCGLRGVRLADRRALRAEYLVAQAVEALAVTVGV